MLHVVIAIALLTLAPVVAGQELPSFSITVERFVVVGDNPLSESETERVLSEYTGEYSDLDGLLAATDALEKAFAGRGYSFHRVILPRQKLSGGVVKLQTLVYQIGVVEVQGNKHFERDNILVSVPNLKPGVAPNTREIGRAISNANRHPSKQLDINLRESQIPDAIDAVITVEDRKPWNVFTAYNNIGSDDTGETRITVGGQYHNLWNWDHRVTATYTTAPENTGNVRQYGVTYSLPVYFLYGELTSFYLKSDVDSGQVGDLDVSGAGEFIGFSFQQVLQRIGRYRHEWSVSLQDRLFDNDVDFLNIPLGVSVRSRPFELRYSGSYAWKSVATDFNVSYVTNLDGGHRNNDFTYNLARVGADAQWNAWRFGGSASVALPKKWVARASMRGQISDEALIAGEQFGLGGSRSIRGFEERIVAADNGLSGNVEIYTPALEFYGTTRFFAFYDYGYKDLENVLPGQQDESDFLSSAGIGLRWQWREYVSVSIDYGHTIERALLFDGAETGNVKTNFSIFARY